MGFANQIIIQHPRLRIHQPRTETISRIGRESRPTKWRKERTTEALRCQHFLIADNLRSAFCVLILGKFCVSLFVAAL